MKFQKFLTTICQLLKTLSYTYFHIFRTILAIFGTSKFFNILICHFFHFHPHSNPQDPLPLSSNLYVNQALYTLLKNAFHPQFLPHIICKFYISSLLFPLHLPISNLQLPALNSALISCKFHLLCIQCLPSPSLSPLFSNSLLHHSNLLLFSTASPHSILTTLQIYI